MDILTILGAIAGAAVAVVGLVAGIVQVVQYIEQRREKASPASSKPEAIAKWTAVFPAKYPIEAMFLQTGPQSTEDLLGRIQKAKIKFTAFGLTRNFYVSEECRKVIESKACEIPITFFLMDPKCDSRKDRYRIEPIEAALENPERFIRHVVRPYREMLKRLEADRIQLGAGLKIYFYNFPCSFAMEEIDDVCRIMLYGHGKRGTDGPIIIFRSGNPYHQYFTSQLRWIEDLAVNGSSAPWRSKGIRVWPLSLPGK